jgi:DsbC/DsbD-like thiol-disulfide interchange protein
MRSLLLSAIILCFASASLQAEPVRTPHTEAELVSETLSLEPGKSAWIALRLNSKKGWHTYWRYAGDSGLPTTIAWQLPPGFKASSIQWPMPERFKLGPLLNYGYHGEVLLLTKIETPAKQPISTNVTLRAKANWLACEKICVPEQAELSLTLPVENTKPATDKRWYPKFEQTRKNTPQQFSGVTAFQVQGKQLSVTLKLPNMKLGEIRDAEFFPHRFGVISHAASQTWAATPDGVVMRLTAGPLVNEKMREITGTVRLSFKVGEKTLNKSYDVSAAHQDTAL